MTTTELRTLALALQHRIADSYTALLPAYTECVSWTLDGADTALPTIAELKAVYNAFNVFEKPDYRLVEEVRALKATTDDAVALVDQIAPFPHTHSYADITSVPATFEPDAHSHVKADVTDFPTAFPPAAHSHVKADVTDFPTTMPPSAHSHAVTAYVRYTGTGAASRVLTLSASIMPTAILIMRDSSGMAFYWLPPLGSYLGGEAQLHANAISVTAGTVTLTSANGNGYASIFSLIAWGNAV